MAVKVVLSTTNNLFSGMIMKRYLKVLHVSSWIPVASIKLALAILGLITVPLALSTDSWPRWAWVWGNDEDNVPNWWIEKVRRIAIEKSSGWHGVKLFIRQIPVMLQKRYPAYWWYAIRNPVNNSRFIFKDRDATLDTNWIAGLRMEAPEMINRGQAMAYRWAYSGPFAGYRRIWLNGQDRYSEIWFGWKVGSTVPGLGFTLQYRPNRKIGS